jgi:beta-aspartyl-peptidase (threonine type)
MYRLAFLLLPLILTTFLRGQERAPEDRVVLVIHGGAGAPDRDKMPLEIKKQYHAGLEKALRAGQAALQKAGGTSIDAVEAAIKVMEDSGLFNAGKGAVFNRDGRNELNASIMDGKTRQAGAVAGICRIRNPISAARAVMLKSPHVFLIGEGAERFARDVGLEMVSPLYFWTEGSWKDLREAEAADKTRHGSGQTSRALPGHFGTVGAVAVDGRGNLAAGTSTGGLTFVFPGRVGDSPIIGAGTYAENDSLAVSCTGHGEIFMRYTVAIDIAARIKYKNESLAKAAQDVLNGLPREPGGVGGLIGLDRQGHMTAIYNTSGMYRGHVTAGGKTNVAIYDKD